MNYTEEQKATFRELFSARRRRQLILAVPLVLVIIGLALVRDRQGSTLLGMPGTVWPILAVVFILGGLAFSLWNWRCPACNGYLGRGINPKFCAKCGAPLQ